MGRGGTVSHGDCPRANHILETESYGPLGENEPYSDEGTVLYFKKLLILIPWYHGIMVSKFSVLKNGTQSRVLKTSVIDL